MNDSDRRDLADRCASLVVTWAGDRGMTEQQLRERLPDLDHLDYGDRFNVLTLLARHKYIASDSRSGEWRFWGRHRAPSGAYMAAV